MLKPVILAALVCACVVPAHARDNNPFSGARSMTVTMAREKPFRLHCTLDGKPFADWRGRAGHYRVKLGREWSSVPDAAAAPMILLMWADGARCARQN